MKLLCLVFALYVALLSVRPCCPDMDCNAGDVKTNGFKGGTTQGDNDCTGCPPFFACGACTAFIIAKQPDTILPFPAHQKDGVYPPYCQPGVQEITLSIWQPPKLV